MHLLLLISLLPLITAAEDERKFHTSLDRVPIFSMPYIGNIAIPRPAFPVNPSPVSTTKVLSVVTKYVMQNPVCIKVSGKKPLCKSKKPQSKFTDLEYTVVSNGYDVQGREEQLPEDTLQSSIEERRVSASTKPTPSLTKAQINEILIEDRLDHLEAILPHYTRRRVFETKTITVTRTLKDTSRDMATLLVKNCIPLGIERCTKKKRKKTFSFFTTDVVRA